MKIKNGQIIENISARLCKAIDATGFISRDKAVEIIASQTGTPKSPWVMRSLLAPSRVPHFKKRIKNGIKGYALIRFRARKSAKSQVSTSDIDRIADQIEATGKGLITLAHQLRKVDDDSMARVIGYINKLSAKRK